MDAREIESLSMLSRGFQELRDVNPELSFKVILDILAGLNEYAAPSLGVFTRRFSLMSTSVMRPYDNTCRPRGGSSPTGGSLERAR